MITIRQKGDFSKVTGFLEKAKSKVYSGILDKYGQRGVAALMSATPVDTGKTATSWYYSVEYSDKGAKLSFSNSNIVDYVPIAIIIQYGHATRNGGWVEGINYINPALAPIFRGLADEAWREVTGK